MAQYGSDQNYGSAGLDMVALRPWYGKRYTDTWYRTAMVLLYCYSAVLMVCYPFSSDFTNLDSDISVTLCHTWSAHALHAATATLALCMSPAAPNLARRYPRPLRTVCTVSYAPPTRGHAHTTHRSAPQCKRQPT